MSNRFNKHKYPGAKRLMLEAQELKDKTEDYCAQPIDDNLFEWHFTVRGPPDTAFEGGYYHGRLSFPTEYPMKPPSIILLTPNGRFETNKKICLSISGYHPETWQPSWSVRTALLALIAFMPTKANRAIGSLDFSDAERRKLAKNSRTWHCETCGLIKDLLMQPEHVDGNIASSIRQCKASTSSKDSDGGGSQADESQDGKSLSSDRSDSDGETRDSSTDSERSALDNHPRIADGCPVTTSNKRHQLQQNQLSLLEEGSDNSPNERPVQNGTNQSASPDHVTITTTSDATQSNLNRVERRGSSQSLVFISIFILLFLLILRRVVMMIQS